MRFERSWHRWLTWCFAILIALAIACIEYINNVQHQYIQQTERDSVREELSIIRSRLEALIISDIYLVNSLPVVVAANSEFSPLRWREVAQIVIERSSHIKGIILAPDDVIKLVYPHQYERYIGTHIGKPTRNQGAKLDYQLNQEPLVADAVELDNGDLGLVARVPIYTDPPFNQRYWGNVSVVINLKNLLDNAGVSEFAKNYSLAIAAVDEQLKPQSFLLGDASTLQSAFASELVLFPNGTWIIAASANQSAFSNVNWYHLNSARLIGYSSLLLLCGAYFAVSRLYRNANQRSLHDELTGLPNRRYFMFTFKRQFDLAKRAGSKERFALLNIDLDKFKEINDLYGHDAGDKVLEVAGQRIQIALRSSDVVARVGGDEFLILLPRIMEQSHLESVIESIRNHLTSEPIQYDSLPIKLYASIGYAIYQPNMESVEDMFKIADAAMYRNKLRITDY
ncbi:sensor domain-containing diguanylate cyclase [Vibrio ponticus]|nr:diguanylate cyclase [Vibrio ponticus]